MRRAVSGALALVVTACTEPVDRLTEVITRRRMRAPSPTGDRLTEIVGECIVVETPFPNGDVGTTVSVTGIADVVGAALTVRVLDEQGASSHR